MRIVYFTQSLRSCWNHGNAHFLRGVLRELARLGHDVVSFEPEHSWSLDNLRAEPGGPDALRRVAETTGPVVVGTYAPGQPLGALVEGADVVIAHEWNDPTVIASLGALREAGQIGLLLFHDTHHRAVSAPDEIDAFDLRFYDGVLAFGRTLAEAYAARGWAGRVFVWHEAADTVLFKPPSASEPVDRAGLVWIGNWGDDERTAELDRFLLSAARDAGLALDVYGVRYPDEALARLARYGARYRGWLPNLDAPAVFARHLATVHVPRRFYVDRLPGIPTIRVFEALACGIPLVCSPWDDSEGLFTPGEDYLVAHDHDAMVAHLRALAVDPELRRSLSHRGLATIRARHSCAHRASEVVSILDRLATRTEPR